MAIKVPTDSKLNGAANSHSESLSNGNANGHSERPAAYQEPIAICGMAMRLPGGLNDADSFWDVLYNGKDMQSPIPSDRYNALAFSDALGKKGAIKTQKGYFLSNDLSCLDASFFSMTKADLEKTDPQQRQILEVTRECLENAGEVDWRGKPIGCYVGMFGEDWQHSLSKENQISGTFAATGDLMMANRVSYEFDFKGPSMVIKTGCSASLVCLHAACRALQSGDSDGAIVAGTSIIMGPYLTSAMTQQGILSPDGSCKSFDASANGFARAEAINAIYVKRLDDALRDGNPIRAVIRGTLSNSDGKSESLMAPNGESQEAMMRKVYCDTGLNPSDTVFVECHGTGTVTGDPIETTAVGNVFGENGIIIGSVKPNIGHAEGASGINSVIKAVLALEHLMIPPNIKFDTPNPKIPFAEKKLQVPLKPTAWPKGRAERISVNSFGIGGTNAHVILDSLRQARPDLTAHPEPAPVTHLTSSPQLMLVSANTPDSLKGQVSNVQQYLQAHPERVSDIAYTLSQRREHLPHRTFFIAREGHPAEVAPFSKVPKTSSDITMVFSGQGAQWAQMGMDLLESDPAFREDITAMDDILRRLKHPPQWSIETELRKPAEASQVNRAEFAQPLCTAIQIALVNALARNGIHPDAVVGHSSGEIAAAYATEAISMAEAMIVAYYRGFVTKEQDLVGGMAAIGLGSKIVSSYLVDGVVVACQNSPSSTTISGDLDQLRTVMESIKASNPDVLLRELKVDMAYHSDHMKELASKYMTLVDGEIAAQGLTRSKPRVPLYSSVLDEVVQVSMALDAQYWASNLTSPVRFHPAVARRLRVQPQNIFLEVGPHATLAGPLRQICAETRAPSTHVPTMLRSKNCVDTLLFALGQLYQNGVRADFKALIPRGRVLTDFPAYAWDHSAQFWAESRISRDWRFRPHGHHAILGQRVPETSGLTPTWRVVLDLEDEPWLYDHKVRDDIVFPFAGYVSMVGEAVRQITGVESGYSVRHVVAHTALVLSESKPVEVLTTLRQHKLTDSNNECDSYEFIISSYSGSTWIKHCEGRVKPKTKPIPAPPKWEELPRRTSGSRWYDVMARVGLVYGPEFQGLTDLSASAVEPLAAGVITNPDPHQHGPFLFHPAAIDSALQLVVAAMTRLAARNFVQLAVPTLIEELHISRSTSRMEARAWTSADGKETGLDVLGDDEVVMRLRGARLTPLEDGQALTNTDRHAGARLEWYPDFDFMDLHPLFVPPVAKVDGKRLLEELALLCLLDSADWVQNLHTDIPHFVKFRQWLNREKYHAATGQHAVIEDSIRYTELSHEQRWKQIHDRMATLSNMPSVSAVAKGLLRICENTEKLFAAEVETIEILTEDNVLTEIYNAVSYGFGSFVRMLAISKPTLRILEVGAGTGGTTELILRDLASAGGNPCYSIYTFTDISAGFFPQARERFAYVPNMEYKTFDISANPFDQGFEPETYDLILANNVVHATPSLNATLLNLQPLLRPGGHLVLSEVCAVARAPGYIFGNFSGWWLGEADNRKWEPYVQPDRWDVELKAAGFTGTDTVIYDAEAPYQYCAAIVSQKAQPPVELSSSITLLCSEPENGVSQKLTGDLQKAGFDVSVARIGESICQDQDILSTLDLESRFFDNISEPDLGAFQRLLASITSQKLLWLMPHSQLRCDDPRSAQTVGTFRVARAELAASLNTLEIDPSEPQFSDLVTKVFNKVRSHDDVEKLLPDREFAVENGVIKIGRYQPFSLEQEVVQRSKADTGLARRLEIGKPGLLETLQWVERVLPKQLGDHQVEVHTRAVGMNFRDIMVAMGVLSFGPKSVPLGIELSGVVSRVGSKVTNVTVGDRVCAMAVEGCFSTHALLVDSLVHRIPDRLGFEEAATMVACYTTVFQALMEVGRLEKGQSVLIHSAAGGIGHCAIRLCQLVGAEIFATVGSEEKAQYLTQHFNIPRNRIFHSRDDTFLSGIMSETEGRGVDIVLNSLSGELLHASWKCVAEFGKLIELGKRDLVGFGQLNMEPFLANRSYCCVDLAHAMRERPASVGKVMERWIWMYAQGLLTPISPMTVLKASEMEAGFRHLQNGDHIGKAVVAIPSNMSEIPSIPGPRECQLDPEASYLLTGGTGGLGKSIATWMVEQGARELVLLSRSAGKSEADQAFFAELNTMGCKVTGVAGRAEVPDDIEQAISSASKPIKGIVHLAMVLRDGALVDLTYEEWNAAVAPKVQGAWNLHNAFKNRTALDFFIMTSSLVTLVDQPGQGNYAAANTFLESFTQYRHKQGLPASVLGICPIDDIGFVAEIPAVRKKLKAQGLFFLPERELLDYMHLAILNSHPPVASQEATSDPTQSWASSGYIIMGLRVETHLEDPNCSVSWRRDRRMGMYHNIPKESESDESSEASSNSLKSFLGRAADEPALLLDKANTDYLAEEIGRRIFRFMMKPEEDLELGLSLPQIGMDSLMAIELRRWWKQAFGLDISVLEIMGAGTLEELGKVAGQALHAKYEGVGKK